MTDDGTGNGHPEDARLLAHLDGELEPADAARVDEHLGACDPCRRRRDELRAVSERLSRGLAELDVEAPEGDPLAVRRAARYRAAERDGPGAASGGGGPGESGDGPERDAGSAGRRLGRSTFWKAAVLVLGAGAAASAAVPGSPVEGWISDAVRALASTFSDRPATTGSPAGQAQEADAGPQGVSVPVSDRAVVRIRDAAPGLRVHVRQVEDSLLSVAARGARYRAGDGVVEVVGPDRPDLRIEVPASAGTVRITAGDVLLVERVDGRLRVRAAAVDTADGTLSFTVGGGGS